uniref:(northern house mosquito) hypothetical protein n=1 Tax=Culex pipiens TaxID=7175 RepID=A0A8D8BHY9_CULPI
MEGVPGKVVVGVGAELRVDGQQEAPLAAGQQQQFQIESLLQSSPQAAQYIEWFVQQRGYVAELFRREQEVVQRQLAEMHQQQLDFMQQQGHLTRDILAALTAAEQNRETRDGDRSRHEENNKEIVVSSGVSGHCVEHLATSSTETTLNTGCQLVNPSTFGPGTAADALKADFKNSVPATSGTLVFQNTKAVAPVLTGLEWILDPGGDYENLSQPPGAIVSLGTSQQLTQSTLAGPQCAFGCLDDVKGLCRKVILRDALMEQKVQTGRNTNTQALNADLKAFGSIPNEHVVGGAPPAEARFERIRTKLEFEPPPSSPSSSAQRNEPTDRKTSRCWKNPPLELVCVKESSEPGAVRNCVGYETFIVRKRPRAIRILRRTDWDPGPDAAVLPVMLVIIWLEPWSLTKLKSCAAPPTSGGFASTGKFGTTNDERCHRTSSDAAFRWPSVYFIHINVTPAVHIGRKWTCPRRYRCHAGLQVKIDAVVRPVLPILSGGIL